MKHIYAMDAGYLSRLRADRSEIMRVARSLGSAEKMNEARRELVAMARVNLTPKTAEERAKSYTVDGEGRAHIAIVGELTPHAETDACGAYTAEALTEYGFIIEAVRAADADDAVESIVFDINSPGGYVDGIDAAAQAMARARKPTESRIGSIAASAAYWLASQTDRLVAESPASQVGSIGVAVEWYDDEKALAAEGYERRVFTSSDAPNKRPDYSTDEGKALMVKHLDDLHGVFVSRVAEGRGVSTKKVNEDFGRGGVLIAKDALKAGMIDHVEGVSIARTRQDIAGVASSAQARGDAGSANLKCKEVRRMDLNKHKAEFPEESAALIAEGAKAEQARREKIVALKGANPDGDKAVEEAIASGKTFDEVFPSIQGAINRGASKHADGENPADVSTRTPGTGSGADGLTADDVEAAKLAGMSLDEYRKYSTKKEA